MTKETKSITKDEVKTIREALIEHKLARLDTRDAIIDILLRGGDADVLDSYLMMRNRLMSLLLHDCARATKADLGIFDKAAKILEKYDGGIAGLQKANVKKARAKPKPVFVPIIKPLKATKCSKPTAKSAKK